MDEVVLVKKKIIMQFNAGTIIITDILAAIAIISVSVQFLDKPTIWGVKKNIIL
jgi:hypothetical protein